MVNASSSIRFKQINHLAIGNAIAEWFVHYFNSLNYKTRLHPRFYTRSLEMRHSIISYSSARLSNKI